MRHQSYLLDTNTISFLMQGRSDVLREHSLRLGNGRKLFLSAICEAEILEGLRQRGSEKLSRSFQDFVTVLDRVAWDAEAAASYADLAGYLRRTGLSLTVPDAFIAAHAHALRAVLVTHDKALLRLESFVHVEDWIVGV